jgi:hypothetical protein
VFAWRSLGAQAYLAVIRRPTAAGNNLAAVFGQMKQPGGNKRVGACGKVGGERLDLGRRIGRCGQCPHRSPLQVNQIVNVQRRGGPEQ